jgi:hypothetical protein
VLVALREGGCRIEELELEHTDLEDVFVRIMNEAPRAAGSLSSPDGR